MAYTKKAKKARIKVDSAVVHIKSTFNNTIATVTTESGDVLFGSSCGKLQFKGPRKGTPFAATQVGAALAKDMLAYGIKSIEAVMQGPGSGRESIIRPIQAAGIEIKLLRDVTPLPHNGTRQPKKRRV